MKLFALTATAFWAMSAVAADYQSTELSTFLKEFHENPAKVLDQMPPKATTNPIKLFKDEMVSSKAFIEMKDKARMRFCKVVRGTRVCLDGSPAGRAAIESNDQVYELVDNGRYALTNLNKIENFKKDGKWVDLSKATVSVQPWSDDYWGIYLGILGKRYGDNFNKETEDWQEAKNYVEQKPVSFYVEKGLVNLLSPSEKYDFLVGDLEMSMTKRMWAEGERYYRDSGKVELWMGICHGWAPAAYMLERPTKAVTVLAADGKTEITFFPSDIKALASVLWANAGVQSKFVGSRCNAKTPSKDASGRVIDQACFDNNPGTWHASVINQIGINDRSFVMDATYDYEVWNHPVTSYSLTFFNPETGATSKKWKEVAIRRGEYKKDKFRQHRKGRFSYIVGVEMDVDYMVETEPTQQKTDSPEEDAANSVTYRYDLELSATGEILGGEWYSNAHPDFLWTPAKDAVAQPFSEYEAQC